MIVDCHVHAVAAIPGHGITSRRLRRRPSVFLLRLALGISLFGDDAKLEQEMESKLARTIAEAPELDAAVVLAFDAVYTDDGRLDEANTHLYVANDYAAALCKKYRKMLFGASIHPYRKDAVAELERCIAAGAVLVKWLPLVQKFNPADERCLPFYEALAHHRIPLLSHTGGEISLPILTKHYRDPELLVPALQRGVTVIAAHCGTRAHLFEKDYLHSFIRLAREYEHLYGDTSSLCVPTRSYALRPLLDDPFVRQKLVHGSDWPIVSIPPARIGMWKSLRMVATEHNWIRRDILAKRALGFDDAYFHRVETLLRKARVSPV